MWPFSKKGKAPVDAMYYSQVDITEAFGDDQRLGPDEWIATTPLNATTKNPESMGLPPGGAGADEVYRVASKLSELRESIPIPAGGIGGAPIATIVSPTSWAARSISLSSRDS